MRWVVVVGLAGVLGACGASGEEDNAGTFGSPGCAGDDCSACSDCFNRCTCQTQDPARCAEACGVGAGGSGNASGNGGSGNGGSGNGGSAGAGATSGGSGNGGSGNGGSGNGGSGNGGSGGTTVDGNAQAAGLTINEISVWQGVKVAVMANGGPVGSRNAPLVAGRDALFRIYVSPAAEWQARELIAVVDVNGQTFEGRATPSGASSDGALDSSFNVAVPGGSIAPGSQYSVTLYETGSTPGPGSSAGTRYPASGSEGLQAEDAHGVFHLVLVPITVGGFTPDVGQSRVDAYVKRLGAILPITGVEISVRAAVSFGGSVSANGSGWDGALSGVYNLRQQDKAPKNTYYFGLLAPASTAANFCRQGCVAGLSGLPSANDDYQRGSVGLGYFPDGSDIGSGDTMAHELGHATGRPHTQCGTGEGGSGFPYSGGAIGSWGYDRSAQRVRSPSTYKDVMGYCSPNWISDYNFERIFDRLAYVNAGGYVVPPPDPARAPGEFMSFLVAADGSLRRAPDVRLRSPTLGDQQSVALVDEVGTIVEELNGFYYPYADEALGGALLVPKPKGLSPRVYGLTSKLSPLGVVAPLGEVIDTQLR